MIGRGKTVIFIQSSPISSKSEYSYLALREDGKLKRKAAAEANEAMHLIDSGLR
jgi:hypothetical protein